jgi:UPF0176 protein
VTITVAAFYKFVAIDDCEGLRADLRVRCAQGVITGTALIAREGLNATLAGPRTEIESLINWLRADPRFADLIVKKAATGSRPLKRLKVKIKSEIIRLGEAEAEPSERGGTRVAPADWNALIREPGVVLVDTRNAYEVDAGTFEGAIDPGTRIFRDFPKFVAAHLDPAKHPRVAMFCTGGIRCEKASAYLLAKGFAEVYQLDGGILNYLERVPAEESLWRGACFVFDERETVGHELGHALADEAAGKDAEREPRR